MPASITWLDHDAQARERSLRILQQFQEKDSRDELGLGAIRDSFADMFFPGTSTIQTRLRYMLFIPWIYIQLEAQRVSAATFAARVTGLEQKLMDSLMASSDKDGVIGSSAGRSLKRYPSSVYWSGLRTWGIRLVDISQEQYARQIDNIYQKRDNQKAYLKELSGRGDASDIPSSSAIQIWHPNIPKAPDKFPENINLSITQEEAGFLLDRMQDTNPDSLLAHLALNCKPAEIEAPWLHPEKAGFSAAHIEQLEHARLFSILTHGAAIVYNLLLTQKKLGDGADELSASLESWITGLDISEITA
jgi:hypothetical protein